MPAPEPTDAQIRQVYDRMRAIARRRVHATGPRSFQATDLVHEAWLRLETTDRVEMSTEARMMMLAARVMRDVLVDRAREAAALKRGGDWSRVSWESAAHVATETPGEFLALDQAISILQEEDAESAEVVNLKFYAGLTGDEVAQTLGLSPTTVDRRWAFARARLWQILDEG